MNIIKKQFLQTKKAMFLIIIVLMLVVLITAMPALGNTIDADMSETVTLHIYKSWDGVEKVAVIYDPNGGTGDTIADVLPVNTNYTILANPGYTRQNYAFKGWNTAADGLGTSYSSGDALTVTSSITLYAQWSRTFTVTYDPNEGTGGSSIMVVEGTTHTILTPTDAEVIPPIALPNFYRWSPVADDNLTGPTIYPVGSILTITEDIVLYATWYSEG